MKVDLFERSPAECRALIERRLAGRAARVLRRLDDARDRAWYPRLDVLPEDRARVVAAYDRKCAYCQAQGGADDDLGVDYLVPPGREGTNHPDNLVASCAKCRAARRERHLDVFLGGRIDLDARAVYARIARATATLRAAATCDRGVA